jgi:glycosyltransferase involved in cell wall biosynthesis
VSTVSVVIPAHNEEAVIGRCLRVLAEGVRPGELEVIVVANGCGDRTAEVAREQGAQVVETEIAGKTNALRLGDERCTGFPRLYLDADVELTGAAVRVLSAAVAARGVLACSPVPRLDLTGVSRLARRFHQVHEKLTADRRGLAGAGAYLLSESGHGRVFPMPEVLADDGWAHRCFAADERMAVAAAHSVVRPARTLPAVIRRRARVRLGNAQLDGLGRPAPEGGLGVGSLVALVRRGEVPVSSAACFLGVQVAERIVARWRRFRGGEEHWSADRSSR